MAWCSLMVQSDGKMDHRGPTLGQAPTGSDVLVGPSLLHSESLASSEDHVKCQCEYQRYLARGVS